MKIIYLGKSLIPSRAASSIHVMKMCQALSKNGHEVDLCIPNIVNNEELNSNNIYTFYGVKPCFSLSPLLWLPIKGKGYLYEWFAARYAQKNNPDLVYGRDIVSCYLAAKNGLPVIFESHFPITDAGKIKAWLFTQLLKQNKFYLLVVITQSLKHWYLNNYNIPDEKILVAADGADLPKSTQVTSLSNQNQDNFNVGYFGSLYPGKGMEIISKLVPLCPELNFHIFGGSEKDINNWKDDLSTYPNITFHGYYSHSELEPKMKTMDVLICPILKNIQVFGRKDLNIGNWTSPLKIFEYMANCKPIIASDVVVLREVLEHERNALLCNPNDIQAWQLALYKLRDNPALCKKIAHNAYNDLKNKYSWQIRAKKIISYLETINSL